MCTNFDVNKVSCLAGCTCLLLLQQKNAYGEDQETGDLAFKLLQAEFVLYVNFTSCYKVTSNENHFTVSVNSL